MTLHAGGLAYWSYAFNPGHLELGSHMNQLAIAAAMTVSTWPHGEDTHVDCVCGQPKQAMERSFRRGASRRDALMTRAFAAVGELLTSVKATWSTTWIPSAANALCDLGSLVADPRVLDLHLAQCFPRVTLRRVTLAESPVARFAGPRWS